jgi:hypothetical protein
LRNEKPKLCRIGQQVGDPGIFGVQVQNESVGRMFSVQWRLMLHLLRPSTGWIRPTHIAESNFL